MTTRWPGLSTAPSRKPLVSLIADAGTPYLRAILSTVSPEITVTGEPPSQVQCPVGAGARCVATDPVTSAVPGRYAPRPCAPVATPPVLATVAGRLGAGSGCDSTCPLDAGRDAIDPVVSCWRALRLEAYGLESKRALSEQPAAAMPTSARTATCGQKCELVCELARERDGTLIRDMWLLTHTQDKLRSK